MFLPPVHRRVVLSAAVPPHNTVRKHALSLKKAYTCTSFGEKGLAFPALLRLLRRRLRRQKITLSRLPRSA